MAIAAKRASIRREAAPRRISREESKEQTREKLLAAGRKVLAQRGLDATQIRDVIREADLAIGTFYLHFKSKDELFCAIVEESSRELGRRLREVRMGGDPGQTLRQRIENAVRAFAEFVVAEKDLFRILFREGIAGAGAQGQVGRRMLEQATRDLREDLDRGEKLGFIRRADLDRLAPAIIGMCASQGFQLVGEKNPDVEETTSFLTRMILGGIAAL
ncbi:MAG: TetR/AcrR family transcriptional regulator [Bdellovibrionota bacterium]